MDEETANRAASQVQVTYSDQKTPIVSIDDGIKQGSFIPSIITKPLIKGDAQSKIYFYWREYAFCFICLYAVGFPILVQYVGMVFFWCFKHRYQITWFLILLKLAFDPHLTLVTLFEIKECISHAKHHFSGTILAGILFLFDYFSYASFLLGFGFQIYCPWE